MVLAKHIREFLKYNICSITFEKANGEIRNMHGTLMENELPKTSMEEKVFQEHLASKNEDIIRVWDLDKKDWRSFRVDSVISFFTV